MIEVDKDIYSRSANVSFNPPNTVCIIGVGGVGGWVAFKFPLIGINNIILVDPDVLEESNLNRLPYKADQVGMHKVHAMTELIRERRMCNIQAYPMRWEDIPVEERNKWTAESGSEIAIIIDCRDSITPLEGVEGTYITGGYDGEQVTMHTFPDYKHVWGEDTVTYRVTPSCLIAPDLISTLIVNFIWFEMRYNMDVRVEEIVTFDVKRLWDIIRNGVRVLPEPNLSREGKEAEAKLKAERERLAAGGAPPVVETTPSEDDDDDEDYDDDDEDDDDYDEDDAE